MNSPEGVDIMMDIQMQSIGPPQRSYLEATGIAQFVKFWKNSAFYIASNNYSTGKMKLSYLCELAPRCKALSLHLLLSSSSAGGSRLRIGCEIDPGIAEV